MKSGYFGGIEQKIISFLKKCTSPRKYFMKNLIFIKKVPRKNRKGSEASEGKLTI